MSLSRKEVVRKLLERGAKVNSTDMKEDTPLTLIRHLLLSSQFELAADLADLLIKAGADVNHTNAAGQTILSSSLQHLDASIQLTRILINADARIIPSSQVGYSHPNLPLNTFLRALLYSQLNCDTKLNICDNQKPLNSCQLGNLNSSDEQLEPQKRSDRPKINCKRAQEQVNSCDELLYVLGTCLSANPARMKQAVEASLIAEARFPHSALPRLAESIRRRFEVYWTQPPSLSDLCLQQVRRSLEASGAGMAGVEDLVLPERMKRYLKLEQNCMPKMLTEKTEFKNDLETKPWSPSVSISSSTLSTTSLSSQSSLLTASVSHQDLAPEPYPQRQVGPSLLNASLRVSMRKILQRDLEAISSNITIKDTTLKSL